MDISDQYQVDKKVYVSHMYYGGSDYINKI